MMYLNCQTLLDLTRLLPIAVCPFSIMNTPFDVSLHALVPCEYKAALATAVIPQDT